jgi:heme-degrading monooxygenase HmoA
MLLERSEITVNAGMEEGFLAVLKEKIVPILVETPGVNYVTFGRGLENPDKFIILVDWTDMDAHTAFTKGSTYAPFRALFAGFPKGGVMEHFNT